MLRTLLCFALSTSLAFGASLQLNFDSIDIREFTKFVSQTTGKNFVVPSRLKGKITIISSKPIPKKELLDLYIAAIEELGYQAVEEKNYVKIVRRRDAPKESSSVKNKKIGNGETL